MELLPLSPESIAKAITCIKDGGVVAHATETCYGLACDITNTDAVRKVFAIKQRPLNQPISALFSSVEHAQQYVEWNAKAEELSKGLPGPLTLILPLQKDAPLNLYPIVEGKVKTIGVRVSSSPLAQELVDEFGTPLSTTSANLHGQPNPYSAEEVWKQFHGQAYVPDIILNSGTLPQNPPSKVVDLTGEEEVIRRK